MKSKILHSKIFWIVAVLLICVILSLIDSALGGGKEEDETVAQVEEEATEIVTETEPESATEKTEKTATETSTETVTEEETEAVAETSSETETVETSTEITTTTAEPEEIVYDELMQLFLQVLDNLTEEDLMSLAESYGLCINSKEYTNSVEYRVAFTEDVVKFSHATEDDRVTVSFDMEGTLISASYWNDEAGVSAFFRENDLEYGYTDYSTSPVLREDGSKSGTVETNYYEAASLEEALISALTME